MAETSVIATGTVQEQLAKEARKCPNCSLHVASPFVERCPRCFTPLPAVPHDCPGCIHRITCPVAKEHGA